MRCQHRTEPAASLLSWADRDSAPLSLFRSSPTNVPALAACQVRATKRRERREREGCAVKVGAVIEPRSPGAAEFAAAAERLGVASLWVPEVWGYDALTGLAYLAAKTSSIGLGTFIVQLGSRRPVLLATSALSLQELSGGRFLLGVGTSGPRVMEGWHGVRFRKT